MRISQDYGHATVKSTKIITQYEFRTFQVLYHQGWTQAVEKAITGLKSSLLVEHPDTRKLYVNMDPQVWELLRETRIMLLMDLEVTKSSNCLRYNE